MMDKVDFVNDDLQNSRNHDDIEKNIIKAVNIHFKSHTYGSSITLKNSLKIVTEKCIIPNLQYPMGRQSINFNTRLGALMKLAVSFLCQPKFLSFFGLNLVTATASDESTQLNNYVTELFLILLEVEKLMSNHDSDTHMDARRIDLLIDLILIRQSHFNSYISTISVNCPEALIHMSCHILVVNALADDILETINIITKKICNILNKITNIEKEVVRKTLKEQFTRYFVWLRLHQEGLIKICRNNEIICCINKNVKAWLKGENYESALQIIDIYNQKYKKYLSNMLIPIQHFRIDDIKQAMKDISREIILFNNLIYRSNIKIPSYIYSDTSTEVTNNEDNNNANHSNDITSNNSNDQKERKFSNKVNEQSNLFLMQDIVSVLCKILSVNFNRRINFNVTTNDDYTFSISNNDDYSYSNDNNNNDSKSITCINNNSDIYDNSSNCDTDNNNRNNSISSINDDNNSDALLEFETDNGYENKNENKIKNGNYSFDCNNTIPLMLPLISTPSSPTSPTTSTSPQSKNNSKYSKSTESFEEISVSDLGSLLYKYDNKCNDNNKVLYNEKEDCRNENSPGINVVNKYDNSYNSSYNSSFNDIYYQHCTVSDCFSISLNTVSTDTMTSNGVEVNNYNENNSKSHVVNNNVNDNNNVKNENNNNSNHNSNSNSSNINNDELNLHINLIEMLLNHILLAASRTAAGGDAYLIMEKLYGGEGLLFSPRSYKKQNSSLINSENRDNGNNGNDFCYSNSSNNEKNNNECSRYNNSGNNGYKYRQNASINNHKNENKHTDTKEESEYGYEKDGNGIKLIINYNHIKIILKEQYDLYVRSSIEKNMEVSLPLISFETSSHTQINFPITNYDNENNHKNDTKHDDKNSNNKINTKISNTNYKNNNNNDNYIDKYQERNNNVNDIQKFYNKLLYNSEHVCRRNITIEPFI